MTSRETVVSWLDEELDVAHFNSVDEADFKGTLVEAADQIDTRGLCANTTFENIETASEEGCDLVLVHHGGWKHFDRDLIEPKIEAMKDAGLTWYIAHQPLDCADEYGICVALADKLGITIEGKYCHFQGGPLGRFGRLDVSEEEFLQLCGGLMLGLVTRDASSRLGST